MVSLISSGMNSYICTEDSNSQQMQRGTACEKPDFVKIMYTKQEFIDIVDQEMEERCKKGLKEGLFYSIYNWADWFNKEHPDLVGKRCLYVKGAWRTAEEVQQMEIKEFEKQRRKSM